MPPSYPPIGRQKFLARLARYLTREELETVHTAYVFAKYGHRTQYRDSVKIRYFEHPKAVAWILIQELKVRDWQTICVALLHDVLEDTYLLTPRRLELNFGSVILDGVRLVTKKPKRGYITRLKKSRNARALLVKLADRLHNLRTLDSCNEEKQKKQIRETIRVYLPLADLLIDVLPPNAKWQGTYMRDAIQKICVEFLKRWD